MGKWITFEGLGGSGKSTQVALLKEWFIINKIDFVLTKEPGGTHLGGKLRTILKEKQDPPIELLTELLLFEADRHETVEKIVIPNISSGKYVISDRGIDGSIAYQGFGRGMDLELIDTFTKVATNNRKPDLTIFIDVEPIEAKRRINIRENKESDQFDLEDIEFQERVRQGFLYCSKNDPCRVRVLNGMKNIGELQEEIVKIIQQIKV